MGDPLRHADRMIVGLGQQNRAMAEAEICLGALAGRGKDQFRETSSADNSSSP